VEEAGLPKVCVTQFLLTHLDKTLCGAWSVRFVIYYCLTTHVDYRKWLFIQCLEYPAILTSKMKERNAGLPLHFLRNY
jgi:hypothetical protein